MKKEIKHKTTSFPLLSRREMRKLIFLLLLASDVGQTPGRFLWANETAVDDAF